MAELPPRPPAVQALHDHRAALADLWRLANKLKWRFGNPGTAWLVGEFDRTMVRVTETRAAYDAAVRGPLPSLAERLGPACPGCGNHEDDGCDCDEEPPDDGRRDMSDVPMAHEMADDEKWPYLDTADYWRE